MLKEISFKEYIENPIKQPNTIDKIMPYIIYGCFIFAIIRLIFNF